jgi:pyochelin biosynthetic protein PchC
MPGWPRGAVVSQDAGQVASASPGGRVPAPAAGKVTVTNTELDRDLWVRHPAVARPGAVRLICLPHAGGSASFYVPMAKPLAPGIDVGLVQYPGRQDRRREPCIEDLGQLADAAFEALRPELDGPVAFFGHSMGATLAFEIALRMERAGLPAPLRLFVSARRAPSAPRDERVHLKDDDGMIAEIRALSGTDSRALGDEEIMRMAMPSIRADYKAAETYRYQPGPMLRCPISALTGDSDPKATIDEVEKWREHTTAEFDLNVYRGGHFYLTQHQQAVLQVVRDRLGTT